jgi:hypothetical protein
MKTTERKTTEKKTTEKVMQSVAKRIAQQILGGHGINGEFLSGMTAGLQSAGYPEISDALADWESASPEELSELINWWYGERIFKSDLTLENPVKPRKGEKTKAFVSRCMSEEKVKFPKQKQRIAVCLSKSQARKNPYLESGATISKNSGINRRAASMT